MGEKREHAIVIGGSMGGLLATRVLADHFNRVTLVERDSLPALDQQRRGVPQGHHTHGLLASGCRVLENLFPGISKELAAAGAVAGDIIRDTRWFFEGACHSRFPSGLDGLLMSRPFLESRVRNRVLALANVRAQTPCDVEGLAASEDKSRVTGIKIRDDIQFADLTVDATGRGSHSPQ